jgi:hypothetical protein
MHLSSGLGAFVVNTRGYHGPGLVLGAILAAVGTGLVTTFEMNTSLSTLIGFQILLGTGVGIGWSVPYLAISRAVSLESLTTSYTYVIFAQCLVSAVFLSVAQSIFMNTLISGVKTKLPDLPEKFVLTSGITNLVLRIPSEQHTVVLQVYNAALVNAFYVATALFAFSVFGVVFVDWRSEKMVQRAKQEQPVSTVPEVP